MDERQKRDVDVLLVDPNQEDIRLFMESLQDEKVANQIHVVSDGAETLDYLHQRGEYSDASRPDLILLEFELAGMSGEDILEELNGHSELGGIPVIVLTGSDEAKDMAKSYDLHANAYVQKPVEPDDFMSVVRTLENFWLEIVRLPSTDEE